VNGVGGEGVQRRWMPAAARRVVAQRVAERTIFSKRIVLARREHWCLQILDRVPMASP